MQNQLGGGNDMDAVSLRWWETNTAATAMSRQHLAVNGRTLCGLRVPVKAWQPTGGDIRPELACRRCARGSGYEGSLDRRPQGGDTRVIEGFLGSCECGFETDDLPTKGLVRAAMLEHFDAVGDVHEWERVG